MKKYIILIIALFFVTTPIYAQSILRGSQGGTGIGTTTAANIGNCLIVNNYTPTLQWNLGSCGSGGGGGTFPFTSQSWGNSTTSTIGFLTGGFFTNASSTISGNFYTPSLSQGFLYVGTNGLNQTVASSSINLSSLNNDLANLTATNGSLTFSGSYNGSTARTVGLNVGNTNTWSILQNFNYSSSTIYSSFFNASSTFLNAGSFTLATTSAGCASFTSGGSLFSLGVACGSGSGGGGDSFTHPFAGQSATTSLMQLFGNASTTQFTATSSAYLATTNGKVSVGATTSPVSLFSVGGAAGDTTGNGFFSGTVTANNFVDTSVSGSTCIGETNGLIGTSNCVSSIASSGSTIAVSSPTGAVNVDFNLGHTNTWTILQNFFGNASTTGLSGNYAAFGSSATTTLTANGRLGVGTSSPMSDLAILGQSGAQTPLFVVASSTGSQLVTVNSTDLTNTPASDVFEVASSTGSVVFAVTGAGNASTSASSFATTFTNIGATPTIATSTGAGTAGTASLTGGNNAGEITINAVTAPVSGALIATITPSVAAPNNWYCTIWPSNASAQALAIGAYPRVGHAQSTWSITAGATALTTGATYLWEYTCFAQ